MQIKVEQGKTQQREVTSVPHHGARAARAFFFGAALEPGLRFTSHGIKGAEGFCFP